MGCSMLNKNEPGQEPDSISKQSHSRNIALSRTASITLQTPEMTHGLGRLKEGIYRGCGPCCQVYQVPALITYETSVPRCSAVFLVWHCVRHISRGHRISCQRGAFSGVGAFLASFVPADCPKGGGMWGIFEKPLKRAVWNTLGSHAVLATCLRVSSVLDSMCAACCLSLSTGSYYVCMQIHATCCSVPGRTTKTFAAQKGSLWGCRVGACDSGSCQANQEASYRRFTATCMRPRGAPDFFHF